MSFYTSRQVNSGGGGGTGTVTSVATSDSITGGPITTSGTLSLVNDVASPGNDYLYGTDSSGVKGWNSFSSYIIVNAFPIQIENTTSLFSTGMPGVWNSTATNSVILGSHAGDNATGSLDSVFWFGTYAGENASNATDSTFMGYNAGNGATNANDSVFVGVNSGQTAPYASYSNFFGASSGTLAEYAYNSNFFGQVSGHEATYAANSNFFGVSSGDNATNANNSIFMGYASGANDSVNNAGVVTYTGETGLFYPGEVLTDTTTFATATVIYDDGAGTVTVANNIGGLFMAGDTIIGNQNGYTATVVSATAAGSSILIGDNTSTGGYSNSIALGAGGVNTASNQFLVSSSYSNWNIGGVDYTLPSSQGGSGTVLTNDGSGGLSWGSSGGGISGSGVNNQVTYWTGTSTISGDNNFLYITGVNPSFSVGDLVGSGNNTTLKVNDSTQSISGTIYGLVSYSMVTALSLPLLSIPGSVNLGYDTASATSSFGINGVSDLTGLVENGGPNMPNMFYFTDYSFPGSTPLGYLGMGPDGSGGVSGVFNVENNGSGGGDKQSLELSSTLNQNSLYSSPDFGTTRYGLINNSTGISTLGSLFGGNGTQLLLNDSSQSAVISANGLFQYQLTGGERYLYISGGQAFLGDLDAYNNHTLLLIDDNAQLATLTAQNGFIVQQNGDAQWLNIDPNSFTAGMGDLNGEQNSTTIIVNDSASSVTISANSQFVYSDTSGNQWASFQPSFIEIGDISSAGNNTSIRVIDSSEQVQVNANYGFQVGTPSGYQWLNIVPNVGVAQMGDVSGIGNGTILSVNDGTKVILVKGIHVNMPLLQSYANNAAALAGGLVSGDLYQVPDLVTGSYQIQQVI